MHIDYAKKRLAYNREQNAKHGWNVNPELMTVEQFVIEKEFINFAKQIGSDKTKSIIETIEKNADNKYFKVTKKMAYSIAIDILEKTSIDDVINCFAAKKPDTTAQEAIIEEKIAKFGIERVKADLIDALTGRTDVADKVLNNEYVMTELQMKSFLTFCQ